MKAEFDARDFERGVKRLAKDFRRMLHRMLDISNIETTTQFDEMFRIETKAIVGHLAHGYEAVNAIGLHRSSTKPPHTEQAFFLFHEALNLVTVALRTLRGGSVLASDGILRQALELACVAYDVSADSSGKLLIDFLDGKLRAPRSVSAAKGVYEPIGRLYGSLSSSAVHASVEHIYHSISSAPEDMISARIRVGASFDPQIGSRFKLGLIRIERVSVAVLALIEFGLVDFVEIPRLWRRTSSGMEWSRNPEVDARLRQIEKEQAAIERPYLILYPWADSHDREEVDRLLGTTEGAAIGDIDRLREVLQTNAESFVMRYLLGAALQDVGDSEGAASEFEKAWALRPDGYDLWSRLESIYERAGDPARLEDFYRRSLNREPDNYIAAHNLGMLYQRMERYEDALASFTRAHELKPERYPAVYNAAKALLRLGRYQQAVDSYEHASQRDPNNPAPWHSAGVAHIQMGDIRSAYRSFRRAVQLEPGYVASWMNLASVCRELGMRKRALICAKRAQGLAPGDERIERLVRECRDTR